MNKSFPLITIFVLSLIFFQVIPLSLLRFTDFDLSYFDYTIVLIGIVVVVFLGYATKSFIKLPRFRGNLVVNKDRIWRFGELMNHGLFFFALVSAIHMNIEIVNAGYGNIDISGQFRYLNVILYLHLLSLSILFMGFDKDSVSNRKLFINLIMINLPRLLISLAGQRFIFVQSFLPTIVFLLTIFKIDFKYYILLGFSFLMVIFLPMIAGARRLSDDFLIEFVSSTPILMLTRTDFSMFAQKHFIFTGLSFSFFDIDLFNYKTLYDLGPYKVRFDWILTRELIGSWDEHNMGTGGNPVFELFSEGMVLMCILSFLLGWLIKSFSQYNTLNLFLLPHVSAKLFFFWRATYVEFIDRMVYYVIIYFLLMWLFSHVVFRERKEWVN